MSDDALKRMRFDKVNIAAQLVRRADEWIRRAEPDALLRVMMAGGLSAVILEEDGHVRTGIELNECRGILSRIGMIWADLPADESLSIFALVWGASPPPAAGAARERWFAADLRAQAGARRFLHDEVEENIPLFEACVQEWLDARGT
ncbi:MULTISPECIES: hypothetical protein [unclassified Variovorax]|uniref:hypothetical protein n=1 Tax=unclassified Variovorax TaxID=663243 RepID=UPI0013174ABF|nr:MULTISPECIES: hypothetical protein [unclassified Variovorax]VTU15096.1 hypothetical protein SRS16CHR_01367 [Variovorax sp. SRS16]VTU22597.1 hypothetical protein E5CHR_01422 [Variovorax sp. PBL-E5]